MGWSSGSYIFGDIWDLVNKHIPQKDRNKTIKKMISIFENEDCDTICELFDDYPEIEKVYRKMHPDEFEDEE